MDKENQPLKKIDSNITSEWDTRSPMKNVSPVKIEWKPEDGPPPITAAMPLAAQLKMEREYMNYQQQNKSKVIELLDPKWKPENGKPDNMTELSRLD